jgi:hypothetical protein
MSNKQPIAWHEQNLFSRCAQIRRMAEAIEEDKRHHALALGKALEYQAQIELAKKRGLDGFDAERFGKKR